MRNASFLIIGVLKNKGKLPLAIAIRLRKAFYHTIRGDNMVADRIKALREQNGYTQSDLAKKLGITRSSVNAWEMGISVPSTQYVVERANIFKVSTDYLLGVKTTASVSVEGLSEKDVQLVSAVIAHLRQKEQHLQA